MVFWWFMVVHGGSWWFMVVHGGSGNPEATGPSW